VSLPRLPYLVEKVVRPAAHSVDRMSHFVSTSRARSWCRKQQGRRLLLLTAACLPLMSCSFGRSDQPSTRSTTSPPVGMTMPGCPHPPSAASPWGRGSAEIRGDASDGQVWALVEVGLPVRSGRQIKIIWHVTGDGPLTLLAQGRTGQTLRPEELAPHSGSNWDRPGQEWGSSWKFPEPGCWNLHIERSPLVGDIWIRVK
jgi:hypothetical protein